MYATFSLVLLWVKDDFPFGKEIFMTEQNGFIILPREILNWRWYTNANTLKLFLHLLLRASYTDREIGGVTVRRGQLIAGREALSRETGLSVQEIRTALNRLKSTNDITIESSRQYSMITVVSYEAFQKATNTSTNEQPTFNQRATNEQPHNKKDNKEKKDKKARNERTANSKKGKLYSSENASFDLSTLDSYSMFD